MVVDIPGSVRTKPNTRVQGFWLWASGPTDETNSTNQIQFSLFKNGGKIAAKKFYGFEFQVRRIESQGQATVSYSKELEFQPFMHIGFFQRDHDKSSGVAFGQFGASYSVKNLDSI